MKKIISLILVFLILSSLMTSCILNNKNNNPNSNVSEDIYASVLPGAEGFEDVDISVYNDEFINKIKDYTSFDAVKRETSGKGYVFKITQSGHHPDYFFDIVLVIGISIDGIITGVKWINYDPELGLDINYGDSLVGKNINDMIEINIDESYKYSITQNVAHFAAAIHCSSNYFAIYLMCLIENKETDEYTSEEWLAILLNDALPEGNNSFTQMKYFGRVEDIEIVYKADNGAGYVCYTFKGGVRDRYIGVGSDGKARGDASDELKVQAEKAVIHAEANKLFDIDLSAYSDVEVIANNVTYAARFGDGNYYIEITTKGFSEFVIGVIVDADGNVANTIVVKSGETFGIEKEYGENFIGKNYESCAEVDIVTNCTMTTRAYRQAVIDAIKAAVIVGDLDIDIRTEKEKFADALDAALPAGIGEFTMCCKAEVIDGVDNIYVADNGTGYVCVIGTDSTGTFIGVGSDGVAVGGVSAEHKALVEAAVATIKATVDIDISQYQSSTEGEIKRIFRDINYVKRTATGNYIFEIKANGYSYDTPMVILVSISADGKIIDVQTVSHSEIFGAFELDDGAYNFNFIGKTEDEADWVDTTAGATITTQAYKQAIIYCFGAYNTLTQEK